MKIFIKDFFIGMDVKTKGIEFGVYDNDDTFRGDCYLTKKGLIWCEGKTTRDNGIEASWDEFIAWMNSGS